MIMWREAVQTPPTHEPIWYAPSITMPWAARRSMFGVWSADLGL